MDAEERLADGSHVDWLTTLITTRAGLTQRLGTIFLTSSRDQLNLTFNLLADVPWCSFW